MLTNRSSWRKLIWGIVSVNGVRHDILPNTFSKFKNYWDKEYVERIELFAYDVLIAKSIDNDGYFAE